MELRTTREMRRNEQLSRTMPKRADAAASQPARRQASGDKLTLSRQALEYLEEQNRKMWQQAQEREQRRQNRMSDSLSALDSANSEVDLLGKQLKVLDKCQKIAASIMKGNRVPPEDLKYLMDNDPDGYKLAMAMRRENPDPKDEESVLDDEDRNGSVEESGGSGESPAVSSPEASAAAE